MKTINTSLFDFPTLRDPKSNYVYVDKTAQLYEIAKPTADRIYYLPRPRRFGKSLMISTLWQSVLTLYFSMPITIDRGCHW